METEKKVIAELRPLLGSGSASNAIVTLDELQSFATVKEQVGEKFPIIQYNPAQAVVSVNQKGLAVLTEATQKVGIDSVTDAARGTASAEMSFSDMMKYIAPILPNDTMICVLGITRILEPNAPDLANMIWGVKMLRDSYKKTLRRIVFFADDFSTMPVELARDMMIIEDEPPTKEERIKMVKGLAKSAEMKVTQEQEDLAVLITRGIPHYMGEQVVASSFRPDGFNTEALTSNRISAINRVNGLTVMQAKVSIEEVGGHSYLKEYLMKMCRKFDLLVFIDEIDKDLVGSSGGDTSGVTDAGQKILLTSMEDRKYPGISFKGVPGAGKTELVKAISFSLGKLCISMSISDMKAEYVGSSERNFREAMSVITGLAEPRKALFICTRNRENLSVELQRRFGLATFFFDLASREEKDVIWDIQMKAHDLPKQELPKDLNWVGSDIRDVCLKAQLMDVSLLEAAEGHVSVHDRDPSTIERMREQADGKATSTQVAEKYRKPLAQVEGWAVTETEDRKLDASGEAL